MVVIGDVVVERAFESTGADEMIGLQVCALKHAEPRNVTIRLQTTDGYLRLKVEDDGRGLRLDGRRDGIGLKVMAKRAELAGGTLRIEGAAQGTIVHCDIPLPET